MARNLVLRVWRGDATGGALTDYTVPVEEGEVVLDAVLRLQATQAGDLAVRWNCKAGKCGSCSAEIEGHPKLMCMARLSTLPQQAITVTPLRTFPVIRDLVTDVSFNYTKALQIPAFTPPEDLRPGEYRMRQEEVERPQEFRKCIECWLCQDVCHVIRDHEDNKPAFAGPRFFIRHAELDMHPLDTLDRRQMLREQHGLGLCNITKCCTEVCPAGIKITDNAIIPMKERVVDHRYDPLGRLIRTWRRRPGREHEDPPPTGPKPWPAAADRSGPGSSTGPTTRRTHAMRINYRRTFPDGNKAMLGLEQAVRDSTLEPDLLELVRIRASQINGCAYCLAMHNRDARGRGEHQTRLDVVAAWREAPEVFTARERAALTWCETLTELPRSGAPDEDYAAVASAFTPEEVSALTFAIVAINGWNRLAVGLRAPVTELDGLDLPASPPTPAKPSQG